MRATPHRRGYTLIELVITLVLLTLVLGGVFQATERGMDLFRENSIRGEVNARASRLIRSIAKELLAVQDISLQPDLVPPALGVYMGSPTLEFRCAEAFAGGMLTGPPVRIAWELETGELDNGLDDDGDGLLDEGQVVLTRNLLLADETRTVLASGVRELLEGELPNGADDNGNGLVDESGLCFARSGENILLWVSLERADGLGRPVVRTQQTSLTLRN